MVINAIAQSNVIKYRNKTAVYQHAAGFYIRRRLAKLLLLSIGLQWTGCTSPMLPKVDQEASVPQPIFLPAVMPDGVGRAALVSDDPSLGSGHFFEVPQWAFRAHAFQAEQIKLSEMIRVLKTLIPGQLVFNLEHGGKRIAENDFEGIIHGDPGKQVTALEMGIAISRELPRIFGSTPSCVFESNITKRNPVSDNSGLTSADPNKTNKNGAISDVFTVCLVILPDGMEFRSLLLPRIPHSHGLDSEESIRLSARLGLSQPSGVAVASSFFGPCWIMQHRQIERNEFEAMAPTFPEMWAEKLMIPKQRMNLRESARFLISELEERGIMQIDIPRDLDDGTVFTWPCSASIANSFLRLAFYMRFVPNAEDGDRVYFQLSHTGIVAFGSKTIIVSTYDFGKRGILLYDWQPQCARSF